MRLEWKPDETPPNGQDENGQNKNNQNNGCKEGRKEDTFCEMVSECLNSGLISHSVERALEQIIHQGRICNHKNKTNANNNHCFCDSCYKKDGEKDKNL